MAVTQAYGYWSVWVAPLPRVEGRFPASNLIDLVNDATVALRGWNYPHISRRDDAVTASQDWVQGQTSTMQYEEVWRFHTDGLFTHRWRMREDGTAYRGTIHFVSAIYAITEVWEFARRLYGHDELADQVHVAVRLDNVHGRRGSGDTLADLPYGQTAKRNWVEFARTLARVDLLADVRAPAVGTTQQFFNDLGFTEIGESFVRDRVDALLTGRI